MTLLPLGSVLRINQLKVFIIGYTTVEKENTSVPGYFVVSYPLGFTNIDKVFFIPFDYDFCVLKEGYKTVSSEKTLITLLKSLKIVEKTSHEDLLKFNQRYRDFVLSRKGEEKL